MKKAFLSGVVGLFLLALQAPVQGASLSVLGVGTITLVNGPFGSAFSIGDPLSFSLTYTYDPLTPVFTTVDAGLGRNYTSGSTTGFGTIGTYAFTVGPPFTGVPLDTRNNLNCCSLGTFDSVGIAGGAFGAIVAGLSPNAIGLALIDFTALILSSLDIPSAATLALIYPYQLSIFFNNSAYSLVAIGTISRVAETPLPAAVLLFASGLGLMGLLAARRKRKPSVQTATA